MTRGLPKRRNRHSVRALQEGNASMPDKIRVGIVGASPTRGFASISHIPALQAMPDFQIIAVCTSSQASADAAAKHYGAPLAFADPAKLAAHPDVDLVTVSANDQIGLWCYSGNGDGSSGVESAAITAILINSASDVPRKVEHSHESQTHLKQRERAQHF